jgi:hypothetical protein
VYICARICVLRPMQKSSGIDISSPAPNRILPSSADYYSIGMRFVWCWITRVNGMTRLSSMMPDPSIAMIVGTGPLFWPFFLYLCQYKQLIEVRLKMSSVQGQVAAMLALAAFLFLLHPVAHQ